MLLQICAITQRGKEVAEHLGLRKVWTSITAEILVAEANGESAHCPQAWIEQCQVIPFISCQPRKSSYFRVRGSDQSNLDNVPIPWLCIALGRWVGSQQDVLMDRLSRLDEQGRGGSRKGKTLSHYYQKREAWIQATETYMRPGTHRQ